MSKKYHHFITESSLFQYENYLVDAEDELIAQQKLYDRFDNLAEKIGEIFKGEKDHDEALRHAQKNAKTAKLNTNYYGLKSKEEVQSYTLV